MLIILFIMFGIQFLNHRYSTQTNLRGNKISLSEMNRTQSLKSRKVNDIQSARVHHNDYSRNDDISYSRQQGTQQNFFITRSKMLKGKPQRIKKLPQSAQQLSVSTERPQIQKEETPLIQKEKIYFYSPNLQQNMNLYMNRMLYQSEQERKQKLRKIQEEINTEYLNKYNISKTQNLFWRNMRRSLKKRERKDQYEKQYLKQLASKHTLIKIK